MGQGVRSPVITNPRLHSHQECQPRQARLDSVIQLRVCDTKGKQTETKNECSATMAGGVHRQRIHLENGSAPGLEKPTPGAR